MKVLIAKSNEKIISQYLVGVKFKEVSQNTSVFNVKESDFQDLYRWVQRAGYNPFALMAW